MNLSELETKPVKREYIKRNVIKRGELSHLSPTERSREYKRLVGRVEKHCDACNRGIERSSYNRHLTTNKHKLNEEIARLKANSC